MPAHRPIGVCNLPARPRLGTGEALVIAAFLAAAVLMDCRGTPLPQTSAVLCLAALVGVVVVRLLQAGLPRGAALRRAGRVLFSTQG